MGNRPFWQNNPDPAMRVPWQVRLGIFPDFGGDHFNHTYICPHCGHVGKLANGNSIFRHFGYCKKKGNLMSKEELQEVLDARPRPSKKMLMNEYGEFILSHEELLQVASTIALTKTDPRSAVCLKLLFDYYDKVNNKKDEAEQLGFTQIVFEVVPPKPAIADLSDTKFIDVTDAQLKKVK